MADTPHSDKPPARWLERTLAAVIGLVVILGLGGYALAYTLSPAAIRHPAHTHEHYRLVLLNSGKAVDFGQTAFQTTYNQDICSAALTKQPFHFHDNLDQYGHIHWADMTGGLLLKNYGWNFIGGVPGELGYRFDKGIIPQAVPIHGNALPARASGDNYYIYTGTVTNHTQRNWIDFLHQNMDVFLDNTPVIDASESTTDQATDQSRAALNHVLGNIVIFAQKDAPTAAQVTAEFKLLKPLPASPCEG